MSATTFDPEELGLARASVADLRGGDASRNAAVARAVLSGEPGPVRDIVLLNAAAALAAEVGVPDADSLTSALTTHLARATEAIDSGAAAAFLDRWAMTSQRLAAKSLCRAPVRPNKGGLVSMTHRRLLAASMGHPPRACRLAGLCEG